jgi:hypothetical protein
MIPVPGLPIAEALAKALGPTVGRRVREWRESDEPKRLAQLLERDHPAARKLLTQPGALMELWLYSQTGVFSEESMIRAIKPVTGSEEEAIALAHAIRDEQWQAVPDKRRTHFELQRLLAQITGEIEASQRETVRRLEDAIAGLGRQLPVARQLPAQTVPFGDRRAELADAETQLRTHPAGNVAMILNVIGMAGAGKSAFTIELAYRQPDRFSGGILYVDLSTASEKRRSAAEIAASLLVDLGIAPEAIHADDDARLRQLQSVYAESHVMLVLDNTDADSRLQALIPAQRESLVLVTSIIPVGSLPTASALRLKPMGEDDAILVLRQILGEAVIREREAASRIARYCAGLPLALAVIAGKIRTRADLSLVQHAERLEAAVDLVAALDDRAETLKGALSDAIGAAADHPRRLLQLLAILEVSDFEPDLLAAIAGVTRAEAIDAIDDLAARALISSLEGGGWQIHDLIRRVASALGGEQLSDAEIASAQTRRVDWLVRSAQQQTTELDGDS